MEDLLDSEDLQALEDQEIKVDLVVLEDKEEAKEVLVDPVIKVDPEDLEAKEVLEDLVDHQVGSVVQLDLLATLVHQALVDSQADQEAEDPDLVVPDLVVLGLVAQMVNLVDHLLEEITMVSKMN